MIKLEQISTVGLIRTLKNGCNLDEKTKLERNAIYNNLIKYNVMNFEELRVLILSGNKDFQYDYLIKELKIILKYLQIANSNDNKGILYPCNDYVGSNINRDILDKTDRENFGGVLIFGNPFVRSNAKRNAISSYSIFELKHLLNSVQLNNVYIRGENGFVGHFRMLGHSSAQQIRDAINFYEEQVLRQATIYSSSDNLFLEDIVIRRGLVINQLEEILEYFINNMDEAIWGTLTDAQRRTLQKVIDKSKDKNVDVTRDNFINMVSNYTTLDDFEDGIVKKRALDRFIK